MSFLLGAPHTTLCDLFARYLYIVQITLATISEDSSLKFLPFMSTPVVLRQLQVKLVNNRARRNGIV